MAAALGVGVTEGLAVRVEELEEVEVEALEVDSVAGGGREHESGSAAIYTAA